MTKYAVVIPVKGDIYTEDCPEDGSDHRGPDKRLRYLQEKVGGFIELIRVGTGIDMYVNEDGRLRGCPTNTRATELIRKFPPWLAVDIVGDTVIVCTQKGAEALSAVSGVMKPKPIPIPKPKSTECSAAVIRGNRPTICGADHCTVHREVSA